MSDLKRLSRRACYFLIAGAFLFLLVVFFLRGSSPESTLTVKVVPYLSVSRRVDFTPSVAFDSETYYRPIIEYNLFRPLGWTPPRRVEPYRLVGTVFPRDTETPPQAILKTTGGNVTHIVSVGDQLDSETTITAIESKSIVLETSGSERTLTLGNLQYLNPSRSRRLTSIPTPPPVRRSFVGNQPRRVVSQGVPAKDGASSKTLPFSEWETVEGERIRVGDARLKNPQKWRLRRRF